MEPISEETPRRKSLGFDLVRIELSPKPMRSNIPEPPVSMLKEINSLADENRKGSSIPTLRKPEQLKKLIAINQSLSRKCSLDSTFKDVSPVHQEEGEAEDIEELTNQKNLLDSALKAADEVLNEVQDEHQDSLRMERVFQNRLKSKLTELRQITSKYDLMETSVVRAVYEKEQKTELELQEFSNKLDEDFLRAQKEFKESIEKELAELESLHYNEKHTVDEIETLTIEKEKLLAKLEEVISKMAESTNQEQAQMQQQYDSIRKEHQEEIEEADLELQTSQSDLDKLNAELNDLMEQKLMKEASRSEIERQIADVTKTISTFASARARLESKLTDLNDDLRALQSENLDWQNKIVEEKDTYLSVKSKHDKYSSVRRLLEDSIMDFESNVRVLVRVQNDSQLVVEDGRDLVLDKKVYRFSKVIQDITDKLLGLEWNLLVEKVLTKCDVSLIFSGASKELDSQILDVFSHLQSAEQNFKEWNFKYYLQSISIEGEEMMDLLNMSTENSIEFESGMLKQVISQKMNVRSSNDLRSVLKKIRSVNRAVVHFLTVEGDAPNRNTSKTLMFMNISGLPFEIQAGILKQRSLLTHINMLLRHSTLHCKCLHILDIDEVDEEATSLLEALH